MFMTWQSSPYSIYNKLYEEAFVYINSECALHHPTAILPAIVTPPTPPAPMCLSNVNYTIQIGDTCDSIGVAHNVTSAAILTGNPTVVNNCSGLIPGRVICMPSTCRYIYQFQNTDDCDSIEVSYGLTTGSLRRYNPWINFDCDNMQEATEILGSVICLGPQGGTYSNTNLTSQLPGASSPASESTGYTQYVTAAPANSTVANGTTQYCGNWYTAAQGDTCAMICTQQSIPSTLFLQCNPTLSRTDCDGSLLVGTTYCVGPSYHWDDPAFWIDDEASTSTTTSTTGSVSTTSISTTS